MKIVTKVGNLLDVKEGHIVHGCNARGVMGSGVALAVKKIYPKAYEDYVQIHENGGLILGNVYPFQINDELILWNAITQEGFGAPTRNCSYDAIENCFRLIQKSISDDWHSDIRPEIHIPAIGAGLGGGNWEIIREIIEQTVTCPVTLWVLQ
jgi:O-acetyl-ADP-ribose deacetylase (regulator of RNase III)